MAVRLECQALRSACILDEAEELLIREPVVHINEAAIKLETRWNALASARAPEGTPSAMRLRSNPVPRIRLEDGPTAIRPSSPDDLSELVALRIANR